MPTTLFTVFISASLLLAACSPAATSVPAPSAAPSAAAPTAASTSAPATGGITVTDGLGRTVTLAVLPKRVISLAPSNTELLFAVGAGAQVVGRDDLSDYPPEVKSLPTVGGNMGNLNLEQITKLQPDLVLAAEINSPEQVKSMENLKLTVYYLNNPKDLNGLYTNLDIVARLTGHLDQAKQLDASLQKRVAAVQTALQNVTSKPKVFYELDGTDPTKPWTAGPDTFIDQLVKIAGGTNVADGMKSGYSQMSLEEVLVQNPDYILLGDAIFGTTPEQVSSRAGWSEIAAVKNKQVLAIDDNLFSRPGPRLVDGLETLAKILHPEAFK
ncbi:MAG: cobalamin-binding protein [Anaerolineaceae bacterium]|nr:cobalamin-binding protein [Anaerolineaceae bacterium]